MAVKIRLMRIGAKKRPFYRVVAVDERKKRTGGYIELLGTYNPLTEPKEIKLKQDRIDDWMKKGAIASEGFLRIIGKAPQRPPRKPKKEPKEQKEAKPEKLETEIEQPKDEQTTDEQTTEEEVQEENQEKASENQSSQAETQDGSTTETQSNTPEVPEPSK